MNRFDGRYLGPVIILAGMVVIFGFIWLLFGEFVSFGYKVAPSAAEASKPILRLLTGPGGSDQDIKQTADITINLGGDVMLSRVVGQKMVSTKDFSWPFRQVADLLSQADLTVVNLESPFTKSGNHFVPTGSFYFNADPQAMAGLQFAGIDIVNLANNHFGNQGLIGMKDTFSLLQESQIDFMGAGLNRQLAHQGVIKEIKGVRFGFLAYAYPNDLYLANTTTLGIADMGITDATEDIQRLKQGSDVLIITMHAGTEYQTEPNEQQIKFARAMIDAGADLIVGHHPHWVQQVEIYNDKPIIYSLGNLVFDQMWSVETQQGIIATANFSGSKLQSLNFTPIKIFDYGQPQIITDEAEQKTILQRMGLNSLEINLY